MPEQPGPTFGKMIAGLSVVIFGLLVLMAVVRTGTDEEDAPSAACLAPVGAKLTREGEMSTITGHIRNQCGRDLRYVEVRFRLKDRGAILGSAVANVAGLRKGDVWAFTARGSPRAYEFDLDRVDGR